MALPTAPVPTSLGPCCDHTPPLRVYTHAAPAPLLSLSPPIMAVLPSADIATDLPWLAAPTAPVPTSLGPCCDHSPPLRAYTHAAPAPELSSLPPTMAVLPSPEVATDEPWWAPTAPVPTSLLPCWANCAIAACATSNIPRIRLAFSRIVFLPAFPTAMESTLSSYLGVINTPSRLPSQCSRHANPLEMTYVTVTEDVEVALPGLESVWDWVQTTHVRRRHTCMW